MLPLSPPSRSSNVTANKTGAIQIMESSHKLPNLYHKNARSLQKSDREVESLFKEKYEIVKIKRRLGNQVNKRKRLRLEKSSSPDDETLNSRNNSIGSLGKRVSSVEKKEEDDKETGELEEELRTFDENEEASTDFRALPLSQMVLTKDSSNEKFLLSTARQKRFIQDKQKQCDCFTSREHPRPMCPLVHMSPSLSSTSLSKVYINTARVKGKGKFRFKFNSQAQKDMELPSTAAGDQVTKFKQSRSKEDLTRDPSSEDLKFMITGHNNFIRNQFQTLTHQLNSKVSEATEIADDKLKRIFDGLLIRMSKLESRQDLLGQLFNHLDGKVDHVEALAKKVGLQELSPSEVMQFKKLTAKSKKFQVTEEEIDEATGAKPRKKSPEEIDIKKVRGLPAQLETMDTKLKSIEKLSADLSKLRSDLDNLPEPKLEAEIPTDLVDRLAILESKNNAEILLSVQNGITKASSLSYDFKVLIHTFKMADFISVETVDKIVSHAHEKWVRTKEIMQRPAAPKIQEQLRETLRSTVRSTQSPTTVMPSKNGGQRQGSKLRAPAQPQPSAKIKPIDLQMFGQVKPQETITPAPSSRGGKSSLTNKTPVRKQSQNRVENGEDSRGSRLRSKQRPRLLQKIEEEEQEKKGGLPKSDELSRLKHKSTIVVDILARLITVEAELHEQKPSTRPKQKIEDLLKDLMILEWFALNLVNLKILEKSGAHLVLLRIAKMFASKHAGSSSVEDRTYEYSLRNLVALLRNQECVVKISRDSSTVKEVVGLLQNEKNLCLSLSAVRLLLISKGLIGKVLEAAPHLPKTLRLLQKKLALSPDLASSAQLFFALYHLEIQGSEVGGSEKPSHDITFAAQADPRICTIKRFNVDYEPFPWVRFMKDLTEVTVAEEETLELIAKLKEFYKMESDSQVFMTLLLYGKTFNLKGPTLLPARVILNMKFMSQYSECFNSIKEAQDDAYSYGEGLNPSFDPKIEVAGGNPYPSDVPTDVLSSSEDDLGLQSETKNNLKDGFLAKFGALKTVQVNAETAKAKKKLEARLKRQNERDERQEELKELKKFMEAAGSIEDSFD